MTRGPGQVRVSTTPDPKPQARIPTPPPVASGGLADELARVRAQLAAERRSSDRLRRELRQRPAAGGCCRDEAAQAWADNDVLHERLRRYQETHDAQVQTIRELRAENTALRAQNTAVRAHLDRPTPPPDATCQPRRQSLWAELLHRRTR